MDLPSDQETAGEPQRRNTEALGTDAPKMPVIKRRLICKLRHCRAESTSRRIANAVPEHLMDQLRSCDKAVRSLQLGGWMARAVPSICQRECGNAGLGNGNFWDLVNISISDACYSRFSGNCFSYTRISHLISPESLCSLSVSSRATIVSLNAEWHKSLCHA